MEIIARCKNVDEALFYVVYTVSEGWSRQTAADFTSFWGVLKPLGEITSSAIIIVGNFLVLCGGILTHSLQTKPVREPVKVERKETVRDSIVYRDRIQTQTVEVERKLNWWQSFKMRLGGVAIILITIAIVYFLFNLLNHLKP